jgi:predicted CXXCH cytochrome family protein
VVVIALLVGGLVLSYGPDNNESCLGCHGDIIEGRLVHGPAAVLECAACHTEGETMDRKQIINLCLDCHDQFIPEGSAGDNVHSPFYENGCLECHQVHAADHPGLLSTSKKELCLGCHFDSFEKYGPYSHEVDDCGGCHDPHFSRYDALFISEPVSLCIQPCHDQYSSNRSHPVGRDVVDPNTGGKMTCSSSCHFIHSSAYEALTPVSSRKLCESCHGEKF